MKVSFIIPCFNSGKIIKNSIKKLEKKLEKKKIKFEIIIINDGSKDKTYQIIKSLKKNNIKIINNSINLGKSSSLIKGIKLAKYEKVILIDSDMPYFECLDKLIRLLNKNDFVYINRRSKLSKLSDKSLNLYQTCRYYIGSLVCSTINFLLLNKDIGDTQAGLKGFKKPKNFNRINFISTKFFFDAELMIIFYRSKIKLKSISLKYKIYKESSIKIFALENFLFLLELIKVIFYYTFKKKNKITL
jgi:glycosyltransferase involved in cell wall biosynthesis